MKLAGYGRGPAGLMMWLGVRGTCKRQDVNKHILHSRREEVEVRTDRYWYGRMMTTCYYILLLLLLLLSVVVETTNKATILYF